MHSSSLIWCFRPEPLVGVRNNPCAGSEGLVFDGPCIFSFKCFLKLPKRMLHPKSFAADTMMSGVKVPLHHRPKEKASSTIRTLVHL